MKEDSEMVHSCRFFHSQFHFISQVTTSPHAPPPPPPVRPGTWTRFSKSLAEGRVPQCSAAWRESGFKRYCFWKRFATVNVSATCPKNRRCGKVVRRWTPPGLRQYSRAEARHCLRNKWILFVGDSQARTVFNLLLAHLGHSPWSGHGSNMTADAWWNAYAVWPSKDELGLCNGGNDAGAVLPMDASLHWNVTSRNVSSRTASRACTRDYHLPGGPRISFVFVGRLHKQWGALCDLASRYFSAERRAAGGGIPGVRVGGGAGGIIRHGSPGELGRTADELRPPDAIVLSHSAWPMLKAPPSATPCDSASYARDLKALLRLLALGRRPPAASLRIASGSGYTSSSTGYISSSGYVSSRSSSSGTSGLGGGGRGGASAIGMSRGGGRRLPMLRDDAGPLPQPSSSSSSSSSSSCSSPSLLSSRDVMSALDADDSPPLADEPAHLVGPPTPRIFAISQPRTQAPAGQRCLKAGAWQAAQRWAFSSSLEGTQGLPRGGRAQSSLEERRGVVGRGRVQVLDAWHLVDAAESCDTAKECAAQPSPRMRDHVHYHLPVYHALLLNMLNLLCGR